MRFSRARSDEKIDWDRNSGTTTVVTTVSRSYSKPNPMSIRFLERNQMKV